MHGTFPRGPRPQPFVQPQRVTHTYGRGERQASYNDRLRGYRHTMLDDSDIAGTRHARAFVAGALGSLIGHDEIYVSGGAEQ